jgi:hypothetical protein
LTSRPASAQQPPQPFSIRRPEVRR